MAARVEEILSKRRAIVAMLYVWLTHRVIFVPVSDDHEHDFWRLSQKLR